MNEIARCTRIELLYRLVFVHFALRGREKASTLKSVKISALSPRSIFRTFGKITLLLYLNIPVQLNRYVFPWDNCLSSSEPSEYISLNNWKYLPLSESIGVSVCLRSHYFLFRMMHKDGNNINLFDSPYF